MGNSDSFKGIFYGHEKRTLLLSVMKRRHVSLEMKSFERETKGPQDTLSPFNFLIFTLCPVE